MEYSCVGLNDLPDEILMIIFRKLKNLEVLYSLQNVNRRLNKIICDPFFTTRLSFVKWLPHDYIDLFCCDRMLYRFCSQILPVIHHRVKWLDLESSSMKFVLCAADYPNLDTLGLYNIDEESVRYLFADGTPSSNIFKKQITTLCITVDDNKEKQDTIVDIFDYIFTVFTSLISLTIHESSYRNRIPLILDDPPLPTFCSSTLLKLKIRVKWFTDCLYLLDGRFNQLHTLYVELTNFDSVDIKEQGNLPNLKRFSLSCNNEINCYYTLILPLLDRMSNLEELDLYLSVCVNRTFIDGNNLKKNIINCMPRLNQFRFYIRSCMSIDNQINLPSTADIRRTFIGFPNNNNIISYVDYFPDAEQSRCHIYSYPSFMPYYGDITNNFPGGLFTYVRVVSLFDENPFEHEFFFQIAQSFPFMERLNLRNHKPQNRKQSYESNNNNRNLSVINYSFLSELAIFDVHDDYIEQFLLDTKTYLQNNTFLYTNYESLQRVTHNFTREDTRTNCNRIKKLELWDRGDCSNSSLDEYFPSAEIWTQ